MPKDLTFLLNLNDPLVCSPLQGCDNTEEVNTDGRKVHWLRMAEHGGIDSPGSSHDHQENEDDRRVPMFIDLPQPNTEFANLMRENSPPLSLATLELLSNCSSEFIKSRVIKLNKTNADALELSTVEIMRVAGEMYIQYSSQRNTSVNLSTPRGGYPLSGLSLEDARDVELAYLLFDAADKVGCQKFDQADGLLSRCESMASDSGTPAQRIVFYFVASLRERIDKETGRITTERANEQLRYRSRLALGTNIAFLKNHQQVPFSQVAQFAAIQTVIDNVSKATKVHLIDLNIRSGVQWTAFMQALAEQGQYRNCPIELLKITAIATTDKQKIESTGNSLLSFAKSLNLPLSFKVVFVSDMKDINEEMLDIEACETVAVYATTILRTMLSRPDCLESLMRVIRKLKPIVMVVTEVEANHNSTSFVNRFIEAFFFFSAYFDCLDDCMERDNEYRMITEGLHLGQGIHDMIATDGKERFTRNVKIDVWRAFFARFGMEEIELSESSLYQANLVLKQFACGKSCNLDSNGRSLIIGWKRTPINSLSAWKFL